MNDYISMKVGALCPSCEKNNLTCKTFAGGDCVGTCGCGWHGLVKSAEVPEWIGGLAKSRRTHMKPFSAKEDGERLDAVVAKVKGSTIPKTGGVVAKHFGPHIADRLVAIGLFPQGAQTIRNAMWDQRLSLMPMLIFAERPDRRRDFGLSGRSLTNFGKDGPDASSGLCACQPVKRS